MNDEFFKSLKDNLENRPEPTFKQDAWKRMEKKWTESQQTTPAPSSGLKWWLPLLLLLLLGLLGSNFWMYRQLKQANSQQVSIQTDTIYKSKVIVQTDTIYQTKIIRETIVERPAVLETTFNHSAFFIPKFLNRDKAYEGNGFLTAGQIPFGTSEGNELSSTLYIFREYLRQKEQATNLFKKSSLKDELLNSEAQTPALGFSLKEPLNKLTILNPDLLVLPNNYNLPELTIPTVKKRRTIRQQIYQMRPKTFSLGIKGGYVSVINSQVDNFRGQTFGLKAAIGFSSNFKLWVDASYLELLYQSTQIDENLGIPNIEPTNDDYIFVKAEVRQPAYQFSTGFQYLFNRNSKWKPYIGAGYGVISLVPYEVDYEFTDPITNIDLTLEQSVNQRGLIKGQILLQGGINYQLNKHWSWQLEGIYRTSIRKKGISSPNILGIRTGLSYQF